MSNITEIIDADDLDSLKRQMSYLFLDAYGNFDGADILFNLIVEATEARIIKLLEDKFGWAGGNEPSKYDRVSINLGSAIALIKGETE